MYFAKAQCLEVTGTADYLVLRSSKHVPLLRTPNVNHKDEPLWFRKIREKRGGAAELLQRAVQRSTDVPETVRVLLCGKGPISQKLCCENDSSIQAYEAFVLATALDSI